MIASALSACSSLPTSATSESAPDLIPVRNFVADLGASGAYQISPDGQRLMWSARVGLGQGLFVKDLQTGLVSTYKIPAVGVWAGDSRHILLHLQKNGDENTHIFALDTRHPDKPARDLTPFPGARSRILKQLPQSHDLIIVSNRRDPQADDVYRYEWATGTLKLLAANPGRIDGWLVDDQGEVIARRRLEGEQWVFEAPGSTGDWSPRFRLSEAESVILGAASARPGHWWALSNRGRDKLALVELNLQDGAERLEYADQRVDLSGFIWSRLRQIPLAVVFDPDIQAWHAFDPALGQAVQQLRGQTDARIAINSLTDDERWMTATVNRHTGLQHVLYDLQQHSWSVLAESARSRINAISPLPRQQPITFKSRDGLDLQGYLSLPPGVARPFPTVVYVHGGPWARDLHHDGDAMLPFLTNRGYAVLQVNYRGSSGYGKAFEAAAQGEFARKMHSDLTDAVDALVAQGVIDAKRVAMSGASYGGYASLVGMTHTPGKFSCAISQVGMSDLAALLENAPPYWALVKPKWIRFVGDPADPAQRAAMQERSPLYKAGQVQGPILLMHGVHDPRVKVSQSIQMAQALRAQNKAVELIQFQKAGHGLYRWQDRLMEFRKTEDFLASCLGGRSAGFDFFELGAWLF